MDKTASWMRRIGFLFFAGAILIGLAATTALTWSKFESDFYFGYDLLPDKILTTLRCPLLMSLSETRYVRIRVSNPTQEAVSPMIDADISRLGLLYESSDYYTIAPGETREIEWKMTSDNVVYGSLVLVKVYVHAVTSLPSRGGTCGTLALNFGSLNGDQALLLILTSGAAFFALAWGLWLGAGRRARIPADAATRAMLLLTVVDVAGSFVCFYIGWVAGLVCIVLVLLLIFTQAGHFMKIT